MPTTPTLLDRMIQAEQGLAEAREASNRVHERIIEIRALRAEQETETARHVYTEQELSLLGQAEAANRLVAERLCHLMNLQAEMAGIPL